MSKPHASLSPTTNILLISVWAAVVAACLLFVQPRVPPILALVGGVLGAAAGIMQHLSFMQATSGFSAAGSLLEVRAAFKTTTWGTRYIRFLYFSKFVLIALAFVLIRQPLYGVVFGYVASYFSLMFVRELVTLRDTFFLYHMASTQPPAA